jgi:DnaD/phage-associated family protein
MPPRLWVKHWLKKLSDPKIAMLPDWQWRRLAEFEMLAGYEDADGKLPPVEKMCWMLHLAPNKVEEALHALSKVGAVHQENGGSWYVTDWSEDQQAPSTERTQRWREREEKRSRDRHGDVASSSLDSSSDSLKRVIDSYESEIGMPTKTILEDLEIALEKYPDDWIVAAIQEAARNNARSWSYANAILKRWKTDGFKSDRKQGGQRGSGGRQPAPPTYADYAAYASDDDPDDDPDPQPVTDPAWAQALATLQREMPKSQYERYVLPARVATAGAEYVVAAADNGARDWLASRMTSTVARLLTGIRGEPTTVKFIAEV